jgi:hypothetical protein
MLVLFRVRYGVQDADDGELGKFVVFFFSFSISGRLLFFPLSFPPHLLTDVLAFFNFSSCPRVFFLFTYPL